MKKILFLLSFCFFTCFVNCQNTQLERHYYYNDQTSILSQVTVQSIKFDCEDKKLFLINNDSTIEEGSIENVRFQEYLTKILVPKGFIITQNDNEADYLLFYDYGISEKEHIWQETVPVWGQTGIRSSTTTTSYTFRRAPVQETTYHPRYGKIGENIVEKSETTLIYYFSYSILDVEYYKKTGKNKELSAMSVTHKETYKDVNKADKLFYILPFMMASAERYVNGIEFFNKNVGFYVNPCDERVMKFRSTVVPIMLTKTKKEHLAEIYEDIYKDNHILIKKGTVVKMDKPFYYHYRDTKFRPDNRY